ncbi:MAG: hypothetical protein ABW321_09515, partial [Polyangiales bacterium]
LVATADLAEDSGDPGLQLLLAAEQKGRITTIERGTGGANLRAKLDLLDGDTLHVVLLNNRSSGESLRPKLCIGSEEEVASCRSGDATPPAAGSGEAGSTGEPEAGQGGATEPDSEAGSGGETDDPPDAGEPTKPDAGEPTPAKQSDGGCSAVGVGMPGTSGGSGAGALVCAVGLAVTGARLRRSRRRG